MRNILTAFVLAAPLAAFAADEPPAPVAPPPGPQGVFVPYADIQSVAEKLGDVPYKYAAPVLQELQRVVEKNQPPKPPAPAKR